MTKRDEGTRHEQIAVVAYFISENNPESDAIANWLEAEAQLDAMDLGATDLSDSELIASPPDYTR